MPKENKKAIIREPANVVIPSPLLLPLKPVVVHEVVVSVFVKLKCVKIDF